MTNHQRNQALEQSRQLVWEKHMITEVEGGMNSVYALH